MHFTSAEIAAWIGSFLWPFFRVAAMVTSSPVFGVRAVPVRARLAVALALTITLVPLLPPAPALDPLTPGAVLVTVQQILIGLALGVLLRMVFAALELAGEAISQLMGLGFASLVDPQNGVQVPVLSQYYLLLATLVFFALGGHLLWIQVLAESFRVLPVAPQGLAPGGAWALAGFAGQMFAWAVQLALPVVAALLVVNLAFGVLMRAAPQLNVFSVGFPVSLLLGFVLILVSLSPLLQKLTPLTLAGAEHATRVLAAGH
jgi:flagellar biosynthetic protein FliR